MLATILKSPIATETTFAIIDTFTKLRKLARTMAKLNDEAEQGIVPDEAEQGKLQGMMNEVFADKLPLKMRKFAFSINSVLYAFPSRVIFYGSSRNSMISATCCRV